MDKIILVLFLLCFSFGFAQKERSLIRDGNKLYKDSLYKDALNKYLDAVAENPEEKLQEKVDEYTEKFANPYRAAHRGYIDEVILPSDTRQKLIRSFKMLENKVANLPRKKHGNIPL